MSTPLVELKQVGKRFGDRKIGPVDGMLQRLGLAKPPAVVPLMASTWRFSPVRSSAWSVNPAAASPRSAASPQG